MARILFSVGSIQDPSGRNCPSDVLIPGRETTMTETSTDVNTWSQLSLLPPGRTKLTLSIEIDPAADSAHYGLELRDADTGVLVGLHVMPMRSTSAWPADLFAITERLHSALGHLIDPF